MGQKKGGSLVQKKIRQKKSKPEKPKKDKKRRQSVPNVNDMNDEPLRPPPGLPARPSKRSNSDTGNLQLKDPPKAKKKKLRPRRMSVNILNLSDLNARQKSAEER